MPVALNQKYAVGIKAVLFAFHQGKEKDANCNLIPSSFESHVEEIIIS